MKRNKTITIGERQIQMGQPGPVTANPQSVGQPPEKDTQVSEMVNKQKSCELTTRVDGWKVLTAELRQARLEKVEDIHLIKFQTGHAESAIYCEKC